LLPGGLPARLVAVGARTLQLRPASAARADSAAARARAAEHRMVHNGMLWRTRWGVP